MHALVIVTLTLAGLAGVLFGSDVLDRRLTVRSGGAIGAPDLAASVAEAPAAPVDDPVAPAPAPAPATPARHASLARPVAPCHHCRGRAPLSPAARRTPGPLRVPASH
jgi:hypothetical protein